MGHVFKNCDRGLPTIQRCDSELINALPTEGQGIAVDADIQSSAWVISSRMPSAL